MNVSLLTDPGHGHADGAPARRSAHLRPIRQIQHPRPVRFDRQSREATYSGHEYDGHSAGRVVRVEFVLRGISRKRTVAPAVIGPWSGVSASHLDRNIDSLAVDLGTLDLRSVEASPALGSQLKSLGVLGASRSHWRGGLSTSHLYCGVCAKGRVELHRTCHRNCAQYSRDGPTDRLEGATVADGKDGPADGEGPVMQLVQIMRATANSAQRILRRFRRIV